MQLDEIDRQISKELFDNGRISLTALNKKIFKTDTELMSHTGIKKRIIKLRRTKVLKIQGNLNIKKLNYKMMFILLEIKNYEKSKEIIQAYSKCPRIFLLAQISGQFNVIMGVVGQSVDVLHRFINYCGPSNKEGILHSQVLFVSEVETPQFFPLNLFSQESQESICGNDCKNCEAFLDGRCEGCGNF
jgi:DNA-binding Lrp family transcriptional regulator